MKNNQPRLCCIFNYAPHYRLPVFQELEKEFDCDFYFGDKVNTNIKKIDYSNLKGFKKELKNYYGQFFMLRKGAWRLVFKRDVKHYLISWEPLNISLWFFLILCAVLGKKVYSWQHGISKTQVSNKFLMLEKFFLKLKAGTFLYGNFARNNMIRLGFKPSKLFLIYNSLDYLKNITLRNTINKENIYAKFFKNDDPVLLFIGRLTPVKKLDMIVEVHKKLLDEKILCNVVFIGDGEMKDKLETKIRNYGLEKRTLFTGALYDEQKIANYLSHADVCISPGNVGLTAIHSLSYGLPVITNDNFETQMPEFEAVEKGVTGDFFEEDNIISLKNTILNWLLFSKTNREKIRLKCFEIIDNKYNPIHQIQIIKKTILN